MSERDRGGGALRPSGEAGKDGPSYSPQEALATRASAAEVDPSEHAATALDRPRFTDAEIASWGMTEGTRPALAPVPSASHTVRWPAVVAWVAIGVLGGVAGVAGAFFGVWLATRWG